MDWISYNRLWLIPYASALFVVLVEVLVGLFAREGLPPAAHLALGWFAVFAVGRGRGNRNRQIRHERKRRDLALFLGVSEDELADEFAEFMAWRELTPGEVEEP